MNQRKYEAMFIVKPSVSDGDVQKLADRFKAVVEEQGGTVESAGKWDKRKLAYPIGGHKDGTYVLLCFQAPAKAPAELSRLLGIHDDVIRHRVFKVEG